VGYSHLAYRKERSKCSYPQAFFIGWCGMRGFVTIATAFALPASFPYRDTVVLAAFSVVLATLVLQGLTLAPLVRLLKLDQTEQATRELISARVSLARAALRSIVSQKGPEAENLRYRLLLRLQMCLENEDTPQLERLRSLGLRAVSAERSKLEDLRGDDKIGPQAYLGLQEQLDWNELTLLRDAERQIEEI
jgi:monovalent cation/hydrogen antiporter